jgi:hypothetical protein
MANLISIGNIIKKIQACHFTYMEARNYEEGFRSLLGRMM